MVAPTTRAVQTSAASTVADTQPGNAQVLPFRRRRRPRTEADRITVDCMPPIAYDVYVDLTVGTLEEQREAAWELTTLPPGWPVHVRVPEGWPDYHVIHTVAGAVARKRLELRLEGSPAALRSWGPDIRDLVGEELQIQTGAGQ